MRVRQSFVGLFSLQCLLISGCHNATSQTDTAAEPFFRIELHCITPDGREWLDPQTRKSVFVSPQDFETTELDESGWYGEYVLLVLSITNESDIPRILSASSLINLYTQGLGLVDDEGRKWEIWTDIREFHMDFDSGPQIEPRSEVRLRRFLTGFELKHPKDDYGRKVVEYPSQFHYKIEAPVYWIAPDKRLTRNEGKAIGEGVIQIRMQNCE